MYDLIEIWTKKHYFSDKNTSLTQALEGLFNYRGGDVEIDHITIEIEKDNHEGYSLLYINVPEDDWKIIWDFVRA